MNKFDSDSSFVFLLVVSKKDEFPNLIPVVEPIEPMDGGLGVCDEMPIQNKRENSFALKIKLYENHSLNLIGGEKYLKKTVTMRVSQVSPAIGWCR